MKRTAPLIALMLAMGLAQLGLSVRVAQAQDPRTVARDAVADLAEAADLMARASSARDRVTALGAAVRAYEDGLGALRDGLRRSAVREAELTRKLQTQEGEVAQLLGVLSAQSSQAGPAALLHPGGPLALARAGMLVTSVTPALVAKADRLREDLNEVARLRALQQDSADTLRNGLAGAQEARAALSRAIAERSDLPRRFAEDPVRTAILKAATQSLTDFASAVHEISPDAPPTPSQNLRARAGTLPWPARGTVLRRAGEADAAGVTRPGVVLATRPRALVSAPSAATVRYAGALRDNGLVVILEPEDGLLFVMAGLETLYVDTGQVLSADMPLGLMGAARDELSLQGEGGGADHSETLYIEVRDGERTTDPLRWFTTDKG